MFTMQEIIQMNVRTHKRNNLSLDLYQEEKCVVCWGVSTSSMSTFDKWVCSYQTRSLCSVCGYVCLWLRAGLNHKHRAERQNEQDEACASASFPLNLITRHLLCRVVLTCRRTYLELQLQKQDSPLITITTSCLPSLFEYLSPDCWASELTNGDGPNPPAETCDIIVK